jgi:hypothetical protein
VVNIASVVSSESLVGSARGGGHFVQVLCGAFILLGARASLNREEFKMRRFAVVLLSTLFPFSLLSFATQSALADDETSGDTPPPAAAPGPPPGAVLVPIAQAEPEPVFKQFAVIANPLGVTIGRYSIQGEWLPALHHALTVNPFYNHTPIKVTDSSGEHDLGSLSGFGGELGYKYYSGRKGPNGFFVSPSFLFASYSSTQSGRADNSFTSFGGAIDIGGQGVIGDGFVIGGGFGLQWTKTSEEIPTNDLNIASAVIAGGGTRPRFLFTLGYAF